MFWEVTEIKRMEAQGGEADAPEPVGRFVLHRHTDAGGEHFDLRLENGDCLVGFRIAGAALEAGCWATEKLPHPVSWLEQDRDAHRERSGVYGWLSREEGRCSMLLRSEDETVALTLERCPAPQVDAMRALADVARAHRVSLAALPGLAEDGWTARTRAVERFCGLSRALDGDGFDETGWRRLLAEMTLTEIGERLAKVETRHDRAHPPSPMSRPEKLPEDETTARARTQQAFRIAGE